MFRKISLALLFFTLLYACGEDDSATCVSCSQEQTLDFTLCEEGDGTASVNGQNTGVPYNVYLEDLRAEGVVCGGS